MERLTRDAVALSFEDVGKGAPPVLLIHGLGSDHHSLQPQIEHFRARHRVVAVDLPGHGQSEARGPAYTVADFAENLIWLCHESGLYRPVAVGHGIGGLIAVELAASSPDLLSAVVALDAPIIWPPDHRDTGDDDSATWDWAAALARCRAPLLYVASERLCADVERLRTFCPHLVAASVAQGRLDGREAAGPVNRMIEAFLNCP